jgi:hypothetical protein
MLLIRWSPFRHWDHCMVIPHTPWWGIPVPKKYRGRYRDQHMRYAGRNHSLRGRPEAKFQKNQIIVSYPFYHTRYSPSSRGCLSFFSYHTIPFHISRPLGTNILRTMAAAVYGWFHGLWRRHDPATCPDAIRTPLVMLPPLGLVVPHQGD